MEDYILKAKTLFFDASIGYIQSLDWPYILTLMIVVYLFNERYPKDHTFRFHKLSFKSKRSYRVGIFGLALAFLFYWFNGGSTREDIQTMFQSVVASMAFYTWVLSYVIAFLKRIPMLNGEK